MKYTVLESVGIGSKSGRIGKIGLEIGNLRFIRVVYNDYGYISISNVKSYVIIKGEKIYFNKIK